MTDIVGLSLGEHHSMILLRNGSVWSTAIVFRGSAPALPGSNRFVQVIASGVIAVAAGTGFSIALKQGNSVWAMGRNYQGQLGDGTKVKKSEFIYIEDIPDAKAADARGGHSMVMSQQGHV